MNIIAAIIIGIINRKFLSGQTRPDFAQIIEQNRGHNRDHNPSTIATIDCTYYNEPSISRDEQRSITRLLNLYKIQSAHGMYSISTHAGRLPHAHPPPPPHRTNTQTSTGEGIPVLPQAEPYTGSPYRRSLHCFLGCLRGNSCISGKVSIKQGSEVRVGS